jgi:shikimate dehydrogenase
LASQAVEIGVVDTVSTASLQPILALISQSAARNPSQYMFEKAFARHELDWRYLSLEIEPEGLADAVRGIKAMGFHGGNFIYPHQRAVCEHLDSLGRVAELTGVVNCIVRREDQLVGENTEGQAFLEALRRSADPAGKRIVLLRAGEMARAIGVELALAGAAEIVIVAHDEPAGNELVELITGNSETSASFVAWDDTYVVPTETDLLVNAASTEADDPDLPLPLDLEEMAEGICVADVRVDPPDTWLIKEAQQRGATSIDGLEMYIQQAVINLKLWTNVDAEPTVIREAVEEFLEL